MFREAKEVGCSRSGRRPSSGETLADDIHRIWNIDRGCYSNRPNRHHGCFRRLWILVVTLHQAARPLTASPLPTHTMRSIREASLCLRTSHATTKS